MNDKVVNECEWKRKIIIGENICIKLITVVHGNSLLDRVDWIVRPELKISLSIAQNIRTNIRVPRHRCLDLMCPDYRYLDPAVMSTLFYCHSFRFGFLSLSY